MVKEQRLSNKIVRRSFAKIDEALGMPNLIDVQKKSYNWFIEEGLKEVLHEAYVYLLITLKICALSSSILRSIRHRNIPSRSARTGTLTMRLRCV